MMLVMVKHLIIKHYLDELWHSINKVRFTRSFLDKKPATKNSMFTKEELNKVKTRLEHKTKITEMSCSKGQLD
jgi:hypothetical protein